MEQNTQRSILTSAKRSQRQQQRVFQLCRGIRAQQALPGHKDGCTFSLTARKTPLRVAGVEVLDGSYTIGLDPLYDTTANEAGGFDYTGNKCRDSQKLSGSITADYEDTGIVYSGMR